VLFLSPIRRKSDIELLDILIIFKEIGIAVKVYTPVLQNIAVVGDTERNADFALSISRMFSARS
jgi:hypothetical protein